MMEHENSRLIGQLIGQMEGMTNELKRLNTTMEASVDATHQRFEYERKEVHARFDKHENEIQQMKSAKTVALAHLKGGAVTATIIVLIFAKGVYSTVVMVLGALSGIKIG